LIDLMDLLCGLLFRSNWNTETWSNFNINFILLLCAFVGILLNIKGCRWN